MLLPSTCVVCRRPGSVLCLLCRADLSGAPALTTPDGLDHLWALLAYEGAGRELVAAIKYHHRRSVVGPLSRAMAGLLDGGGDPAFDVVAWVPTTPSRRRARGFDQARLLANGVARARVLPCRALLRRRRGPPQTGRPAHERADGPSLAVRRVPRGVRVLLVDDVVTTGASMRAAAGQLRAAGAGAVSGLSLARTPLKTGVRPADTIK